MLFSGARRFGLFLAAARGWAALSVAAVVLACALVPGSASSAAPGGAGHARVGRGSELSLSRAPAGLRAAVRRTLGARVASGGWSLQAKLSERHGTGGDGFGSSVAVYRSTAVVGVYGKNAETGVAYVFARSGRTWSQQAKLSARHGEPFDEFGFSVAISGQTAVVGAPGMAPGAGRAYVFVRSGRSWSQQATLTASAGTAAYGAEFGSSVAISGQTAVVGANVYGKTGAAYVFVRSGTTWSRQQKLTASNAAAADYFGTSVAISGSTAVVGAPFSSDDIGAAYVFVRSGTTWSQQKELTASDASAGTVDDFGWSVALSGATVIVGAYGLSGKGAAYVFVRSGTSWSQRQKLTASDAAKGDEFGYSVAISGSTAVVCADHKNKTGAAYVFVRSGTSWSQRQKLTASDAAKGDEFGYSVAISGATAVIGAPAPGKRFQTGAAYVFVRG
jgi:FG-GAP repeat